jgi:hypothetical protein
MTNPLPGQDLARQFLSGTGIVSRDAPSQALCERMIMMTAAEHALHR